ncbi:hypothetical protein D3C85_1364940 [compost metagenome]
MSKPNIASKASTARPPNTARCAWANQRVAMSGCRIGVHTQITPITANSSQARGRVNRRIRDSSMPSVLTSNQVLPSSA